MIKMKPFTSQFSGIILLTFNLLILSCTGTFSSANDSTKPPKGNEARNKGFVLKTGGGEEMFNGIVIRASPANGTEGSILVEQSFPKGGTTSLHIHDQGDELFYVVSGRGYATLGEKEEEIGPGDVVFVARGSVHQINNPDDEDSLKVVFFMDRPELVEEFRAVHERMLSQPGRPLTKEEKAEISRRIGGSRPAEKNNGR